MDQIKVIITGAGALLGQGIIRALKQSTLKTHIVAVDPSPFAAGLYWADSAHLVPYATDPKYIDQLKDIIQFEKPDIVLVGTDIELPIIANNREILEKEFQTHILVSNADVIAIANDKYLTYNFLRDAGFDYPETCLPGGEEELISKVGFPLVVKPRIGARSVGVHEVYDRATLNKYIKMEKNLVIQECVGSSKEEYTASALVFNGRCNASIIMRRDLRDGNTYRAYIEEFKELNNKIRTLGEALKPHGVANFQFRLDDNRLIVFEINSRFSGTTPLRACAGFNEIELCLRYILWNESIVQPEIQKMTILRHWSETIVKENQLI